MLEIKSLGLDQDLNPNSDASGYVKLSRGKERPRTENDNDNIDEDASISACFR